MSLPGIASLALLIRAALLIKEIKEKRVSGAAAAARSASLLRGWLLSYVMAAPVPWLNVVVIPPAAARVVFTVAFC